MEIIKKVFRFICGFIGAFSVLFGASMFSDAKSEEEGSLYFLGSIFFFMAALCFYFAFKNKLQNIRSKNTLPSTTKSEPEIAPQQETFVKTEPLPQNEPTINQPVYNTVEKKHKKIKKSTKFLIAIAIFILFSVVIATNTDTTPPIDSNVKLLMDESGFNQETCEKAYALLQECGIEGISNLVTIVESDGTWYSCRIESNKYYGSGVVNITPEGGLYSLNWGGATIYNAETTKKPRHLDDYTLPYGTDTSYMLQVENTIKNYLKSPSTAEFPSKFFSDEWSFEYSYKDGIATVSSYVDAQNSFGAMIRSPFVVKIDVKKNAVIYINLDGQIYQ